MRYKGVKEDAAYAKSQGEWTAAWINGVFSSIHYFLMDYQNFFLNLALEPEFIKKLIKIVGTWTLTAEEMLCRAGVDCIGFCDDLGSNESLLISPAMYREFVLPWHRKICEVAHGYGVRVHMHTHGNVMAVLRDIADAGVDILNPIDPDDKMPYHEVREIVGDKIVLCGGMDKHFFDWDEDIRYDFLRNLIQKGRAQGPFILMDSAGIPDNVTKERFEAFMRMNRCLRQRKVF
jgi:uroporphyrinogen-III decarboxylase